MIERSKSILLLLLVFLSFYLTYRLWENNPSFDPLTPAEYEQPQKIGESKAWKDLIRPKEIIFNYEDNRHTKATPEMAPYTFLWNALQKWQFNNVKEVRLTTEQWKKIEEQSNGVEYFFPQSMPVSILAKKIQIPSVLEGRMDTINRIVLYEEDQGHYSVLYISSDEQKVLMGNLLDIPQDTGLDVQNLLLLGNQLAEQFAVIYADRYDKLFYLPAERTTMNQWTYQATQIDIQELIKSLFLDTSTIKEIQERSGTRIFTDGTKSLQYNEFTYEMKLFIPSYDQGVEKESRNDLTQSVDFMNDHQGWTGDYYFDEVSNEGDQQQITFRESMDGYPFYPVAEYGSLGEIGLKVQGNQVNEYTRSLLRLVGVERFYQISILSGKELLDALQKRVIYPYHIREIELGYQAVYDTQSVNVKLIPVYVIHLYSTEKPMIIDARAFTLEE